MELVFMYLVTASFHWAVHAYNWKNVNPFAKDMPVEEYRLNIHLRILKKDWIPDGTETPKGNEVLERYPGDTKAALDIFKRNRYEYQEELLENSLKLLTKESGYSPDKESIFVIHTISSDAEHNFVLNIMTALKMRNYGSKYNILAFHMPGLHASMEQTIAKSLYGRRGNFEALGATIGEFFISAIEQNLMTPDQIHIVGFCYSSHLAGYVARYIASHNNGKKIKSITALDPYSWGLSVLHHKIISRDDAQLVYVLHTNSIAYGTLHRKATADFNINSGWMQPGCYTSPQIICSHWRAVNVFWYLILYPQLFVARRCPNWIFFKTCLCNWNQKFEIKFPPELPGVKGKYYLNTLSHKPYGFGPAGANCYSMDKKKKAKELTERRHEP